MRFEGGEGVARRISDMNAVVVAMHPRTRGKIVDCGPIPFAMRGLRSGAANGPLRARLDSTKFAKDLESRRNSPASLGAAIFGL
jgi:hypothetical protein